MAGSVDAWEHHVGRVRVFEHVKRKRVLYLKWREDGNWSYKSLAEQAATDGFETSTLLEPDGEPLRGRALDRKKKWAIAQAELQLAWLRAGKPSADAPPAVVTLDDAWELIANPETGQYPVETRHRKEVERELKHVCRILGGTLEFAGIKRAELTKLWRTRIRELRSHSTKEHKITGLRGAEITVARLLAAAQWLRDRGHIPADACVAASSWKKDLRTDWMLIAEETRLPDPARPRLTADEYRKLFAATWEIDARLGLMYALGAELRGGQIKRARRTDLDLEANTFVVAGRGHKLGATVQLTKGQRAAVDRALHPETGYLRELEAAFQRKELAEYFVFPQGQMRGNRTARGIIPWTSATKQARDAKAASENAHVPVQPKRDRRTPASPVMVLAQYSGTHVGDTFIRKMFKRAETRAGVTEVKGRVWYGGRRVGVDLGKASGISREGLQELGGWSDSQVPDAIYADKQRDYARREAAVTRAQIRGEE